MTDHELLRQYTALGSEDAFCTLVQRHLGLVRGVALRQLENAHQADEVCQAVFIALARKAGALPSNTIVAGWLFRATRFAAAKLARDEGRRCRREKEAAMNHAELCSEEDQDRVWKAIAPHLNEALDSLAQKDRHALLLRFFESRSFAEVGSNLGVSEDAAKMRVGRALEKLRGYFRKRGMVFGVAAFLGALSTKATEMAPGNLAASISAAAIQGGGASTVGASLAESILRRFLLARLKQWFMLTAAILLLGTAIGIVAYRSNWFGRRTPQPGWPPVIPAQQWPGR